MFYVTFYKINFLFFLLDIADAFNSTAKQQRIDILFKTTLLWPSIYYVQKRGEGVSNFVTGHVIGIKVYIISIYF